MTLKTKVASVRYQEIDLLRFIAAISVVFYHYTYRGYAQGNFNPVSFAEISNVTKYGWLGVELFFIISGYVILMSVYNKSVSGFFISRITRLYPAYWIACTLTFVLVTCLAPKYPDLGWQSFDVDSKRYISNMTMMQGFINGGLVDTAYWSLRYEILFYFLISIVLGWGALKNLELVIGIWLLVTAALGPTNGKPLALLLMPNYSAYFASGMLFFMIQTRLGKPVVLYGLLLFAFLLALNSARSEAEAFAKVFRTNFSISITFGLVTSFYMIFYLIISKIIRLGNSIWITWLGLITYPLYLLHGNIGWLIFQRTTFLNKYLVLISIILVMLISSFLIYEFIEKRFSKLLKRLIETFLFKFL